MSFAATETIGDYTVIGVLGSGAVSTVFKARHRITRRIEALKIVKIDGPETQQQAHRFLREIRVQASLNHPNIVSVHYAFWDKDDLVMVMDLVEGTSLRNLLDRGSVPVAVGIGYACQALEALSYAHSRNVLHRDISPANLIVTAEGTVKLTDFGLARTPADPQLTQVGAVLGSLYYMSPEQVKGIDGADARSDIYSLGAVLYETVTGKKLFDEEDAFSIMLAQVEREPVPPVKINPALPPTLNKIILTALAKNPDERFQSADAFRSALERVNQAVNGSCHSNGLNGKALAASTRRAGTYHGSAPGLHETEIPEDPVQGMESPKPERNGKHPALRNRNSVKPAGPDPPHTNGSQPDFSGFRKAMERKNLLVSVGARSQNVHFFIASCLLATVSWYTTEQGMGLYLSSWLSVFASIGVQSALVFVAWRLGITKTKRGVLVAVFAITAAISVSFSYVNLYTWFSVRERPAEAQRELYDAINAASGKTEQLVAAAISEGEKHVLALAEMAAAERKHGHMSQGQDADPYLADIRQAVAREAQTSGGSYKGGGGEGVSYLAFTRYSKLAQQSVERISDAERSLAANRAQAKPFDPSDKQLRDFRAIYDSVPWNDVERVLHTTRFEKPVLPSYSDFVDHAASGQEDLLIAFKDLFSKPTGRHAFAFALAAFIDVIVALLAYAAGPVLFGNSEKRWFAAGAALDALDSQIFVRDFLRKLAPDPRGMARVEASALSTGEQQVCLLLASKELAASMEENGKLFYLLSPEVHEQLLESSGG
jgi:serine/threonine protein kinase